jgi:enoyl-CoA hydratase/carnithine racemase
VSATFTTVLVEQRDHVLTVTLNRPPQRNAFDWTMRRELAQLWADTRADSSVRCVVLTGAGDAFCAGADVGMLSDVRRPAGFGLDDEIALVPGRQLMVPVIVAVNGVCAGGGLHFVADADIVIASDTAWFTDPHVSVGQVSGIEPVSLALRVPMSALYRLALLGRAERWDAQHACDVGLVSEVVPSDRLLDRAHELAGTIAASSPAAIRATREMMRRFENNVLGPWMAAGWDAVQVHWAHPDSVEGPRAFAERREPKWEDS